LLSSLREHIERDNGLHLESWEEAITKTFGPGFYRLLVEWTPRNMQAVRLAQQLTTHAEKFNMPLPESLLPSTATPASDPGVAGAE
jgi:hypothetical protein